MSSQGRNNERTMRPIAADAGRRRGICTRQAVKKALSFGPADLDLDWFSAANASCRSLDEISLPQSGHFHECHGSSPLCFFASSRKLTQPCRITHNSIFASIKLDFLQIH